MSDKKVHEISSHGTSNPATFSTSICEGCCLILTSSGRTTSIRWMNDFALGSAAPFASGFKTVYGWQDGESNHSWASREDSSEAVNLVMSTYEEYRLDMSKYDVQKLSNMPVWRSPCRNLSHKHGKMTDPNHKREQLILRHCLSRTPCVRRLSLCQH